MTSCQHRVCMYSCGIAQWRIGTWARAERREIVEGRGLASWFVMPRRSSTKLHIAMDQHDIAGGALHVWGALHVCLPPLVIPWCLLPTPPQSIMYGRFMRHQIEYQVGGECD